MRVRGKKPGWGNWGSSGGLASDGLAPKWVCVARPLSGVSSKRCWTVDGPTKGRLTKLPRACQLAANSFLLPQEQRVSLVSRWPRWARPAPSHPV